MRKIVLFAIVLLGGCDSGLDAEVAALREELAAQQIEIDRLREFVDAQAGILTTCETTVSSFMDYLVNLSTLGMLREASTQVENAEACMAAFERFSVAAARGP